MNPDPEAAKHGCEAPQEEWDEDVEWDETES